ncbi:MAG TPA: SPOR domain-containing protein [Candidatus Sulfotelmatobacter sp.]
MTSSSEDTEITLGTGKLLVLFFVLVAICAGSFSLGYKLGSKSEPALASAAMPLAAASTGPKPASTAPTSASSTLYKPVDPQNPAPNASANGADAKPVAPGDSANPTNPGAAASTNPSATAAPAGTAPDPAATLPAAAYFVQVAAVSKQEDADALVDALKKKQYAAFVAANAAADKLFRIQVGPFPDIQEAEATRTRLIGDGYNPIVRK